MVIIQTIEKKPRSCRIGYPTSTWRDTAANDVLGALAMLGSRMNGQVKHHMTRFTMTWILKLRPPSTYPQIPTHDPDTPMCCCDCFKGGASKWCGFDLQNREQISLNIVSLSQLFAYFMNSFTPNPNFRNLSREALKPGKLPRPMTCRLFLFCQWQPALKTSKKY